MLKTKMNGMYRKKITNIQQKGNKSPKELEKRYALKNKS